MNPVRSYRDFQEFMTYWDYNGKPIPVLLIKPDVLLSLRHDYHMDDLFDYFNHRTGKGIVFFLPGYSHYPVTSFAEIFPSYGGRNDEEIALTYRDYRTGQAHNVYYNNRDFVDFINTIEEGAPEFTYYGDTELLLPTFFPGEQYQRGNLDFSTLSHHRYNLSKLFFRHGDTHFALHVGQQFLERVMHQLRRECTIEELYENIDNAYINL